MKVGGGLGSEGTLSSVLRVQACSGVFSNRVPFPGKKYEIMMLKDAMAGHERMQWCRSE